MRELVLDLVLGSNGSSVTTTDDDNGARLGSLDRSIESLLGGVGEGLQLEDTGGPVPEDGLGLGDGLLVGLDGLGADVQTHVAVGDTGGIGGGADLGVGGELVGGDVVDGKDDLDVVLLGLLDDLADDLAAGFVEETVADLDVLQGLLEGEGHGAGDDEAVDLGQEVVDQLDLVGDLGATEDGEEGTGWVLKSLGEVLQLLLHEETGGLLGEVDSDHGAVGTVGSTESVVYSGLAGNESRGSRVAHTDVDVTEGSEALTELVDLGLVGLDLLALGILGATLLLGVETQVLEQDNLATAGLVDNLLRLGTDTVLSEDDALANEALEDGDNGLQAVLGVDLAVGAAKVGHEHNGLGAVVNGILDGGQGTDDTLGVGNVLVLIEGDVEVNLFQLAADVW